MDGDVNNGGFSQYFFNSKGLFINEIENAFIVIGANITANICKKAIASFGDDIPKNPKERVNFFEDEYSKSTYEVLEKCDDEFYKYEDNLEELLYLFVLKNKSSFTLIR